MPTYCYADPRHQDTRSRKAAHSALRQRAALRRAILADQRAASTHPAHKGRGRAHAGHDGGLTPQLHHP